MLNRKSALLAAAVLAAAPLVTKAATITFTYNAADIMYTTDGGNTFTPVALGGTTAAPTVTVPNGALLTIGVDATITNNPNPASGGVYDNSKTIKQPTTLGIAAFGIGFTTSNAASAPFNADAVGVAAQFSSIKSTGAVVAGNVVPSSISGGVLGSNLNSSVQTDVNSLGYGGGTKGELFNTLLVTTATNVTITPVINLADIGYFTFVSGGTSALSRPVYGNTTAVAGVDTLNLLPALKINPTVTTTNTVVSLTNTAPTNYGSAVATFTLSSNAPGSYVPQKSAIAATNKGYIVASGFNPATDTEVFALDLLVNGNAPTAAQIAQIIADINASKTGGVVASNVVGDYTKIFGGYDVLLTANPGVGGTAYAAFDFSADTTTTGVTVIGVGAVPEPASIAGLAIGASGLLLGRRKNRA